MKTLFWHQFTLILVFFGYSLYTLAIPAPRVLTTISQPDGSKISVWLKGDEYFHFAQSTDGYILLRNNRDFFTYAVKDSAGNLKPGTIIARNEDKRSLTDKLFLKSIQPELKFSETQINNALDKRVQRFSTQQQSLRSAMATGAGLINNYPTTGNPKSLVILVNFSDSVFKTPNPASTFSNMLNTVNYNEGFHVGSSRDYYKYNSGGRFVPDFVVVGPVNLPKPMSYYGGNDANGDDSHPAEMARDACQLAASMVDFSQFDYDNNNVVDNVYIFFAGKGEADGGVSNTIWPHSWGISGEGLSLTLNGKKIDAYACSAELKGNGKRSGIGTFTHEYGHILGLTDMYDTDYEKYNGATFDLGEWSLMAYGAYNGSGCVPPCLTLLERKLLGWASPTEINSVNSVNLTDLGSTNKGFVINTDNVGEYFLLENRQPSLNPWDAYIPYHGMLIYHIDMRTDASITISDRGTTKTVTFANLWEMNMVNAVASHPCADIEEADDIRASYNSSNYLTSLKGDPFPGYYGITSIKDETLPSMKTWNGVKLNKPLTNIVEDNAVISFDIRGGNTFNFPSKSLLALDVNPFRFTARWTRVKNATGYYLDVYKQETIAGKSVKTAITGYQNLLVKDTIQVVRVPKDKATYLYQVRATNNYTTTLNSDLMSVLTPDATPTALPASTIEPFSFTANWSSKKWATGYYLDVFTTDTVAGKVIISYLDGYQNKYLVDSTLYINELNDQSTYYYRIRASSSFSNVVYATSDNSNLIRLTTPKASAILPFVKNQSIYLMGMDPGASVRIFDPMGILRYTATTNCIPVKEKGIYLVETFFDGKRKIIKILVK